MIELTLPDGSSRSVAPGTTGFEFAKNISEGLARNAYSFTLDGDVYDLHREIPANGSIAINTWDSADGKMTFWHSSAHLLAEAVQTLYPEAKFTIGPAIEQGFYYDIDFGDETIGPDELAEIEKTMKEMARKGSTFERRDVSKEEALSYYKSLGNEYKVELIEDLDDGSITFYSQGEFTDLCRGPHVPLSALVKAVKLTTLAGAYWRGDADNAQLTRIYGISFPKASMLEEYLEQVEEAKKRDHKKLGRELGIYMMDAMVGSGLPIWLPNGTTMRRLLEQYLREEQIRRGYQEVITPHIGRIKLYETSGHYPYYKDSQFAPIDVDDDQYLLKPMNCPHHHRIYDSEMRSYRDLPVRLAEFGSVYRYEQSGELNGLSRVRGFTQDDAHIYCTHDQLQDEIRNTIELTQTVFALFDMPVDIRLSYRDDNDKKYGGEQAYWDRAQADIQAVADDMGLNYTIAPGEASFYGPKIDFIIRDAIGRRWQLGTVQVDYVMPERFDLTYVGSDNQKHRPVIIHRAPFGSMERFMSILIEHFAGDFPLWLAPTQLSILPISDAQADAAYTLQKECQSKGMRVTVDARAEKIGAKIRDAETSKTPYMFILGEREVEQSTVSVRKHKHGDQGVISQSEALEQLNQEIATKALPTTPN